MLKNFFPNKILTISNKFINGLIILMISIILLGLTYSLFISPEDYIQGDSVRIIYVHVPSSFIALGIFACIRIGSIFKTKRHCVGARDRRYDPASPRHGISSKIRDHVPRIILINPKL